MLCVPPRRSASICHAQQNALNIQIVRILVLTDVVSLHAVLRIVDMSKALTCVPMSLQLEKQLGSSARQMIKFVQSLMQTSHAPLLR